MTLTCPKCQAEMRTYERNGVTVDQCSECRGIFLDRGELERLADAENRWHGDDDRRPERETKPAQSAGLGAIVGEVMQQARGSKSHGSSYGDPRKKKKSSFLDELFG